MSWGPARSGVGAFALALLLALALPASAGAHAVLVTSTPRWGADIAAAPHQVTLVYDEGVVPALARVTVIAPDGHAIASPPRVAGNVVSVALPAVGRGSYTVRWRMVASDDGHVTEGAFSFGVRTKPSAPSASSADTVPVAPELLAWLQFIGVVLAGGALTFRALVVVPAARGLGERTDREAATALWIAVAGAALALHAGLFGFLIGTYPIVGGGLLNLIDTQIIPIRVGTHLGQAFTLTTFAWLGVLTLLVAAWVIPRRREPLLASAGVASLAIAFGISWASHPAARGTLPLAADYLHLVAGALWAGGVLALALLAGTTRDTSRPRREALFRACFVRFSKLAVPIVLVLSVAGFYVALRQVPAVSSLVVTRYGIILLMKTLVFGGILALAGYHRRIVMPRVLAGAALTAVRRTLAVEASLLLFALALAAVLSQTAPPK